MLDKIREAIVTFYNHHDEGIKTFGLFTGIAIVSYILAIPYLLVCKKLGLLNSKWF